MAKAKTDGDEKNAALTDYKNMQRNLAELKHKRLEVLNLFVNPATSTILGRYERDIEDRKELLVSTDKKDVERVQAEIMARRSLIATFKGAYEAEISEAERAIKEFASRNALFIQGADVADAQTGEISDSKEA